MNGATGPRCRTCGKPIVGCAITRHGGGWVHSRTNAERCAPPHRTLATPITLDDLNARHLTNQARSRARRRTP